MAVFLPGRPAGERRRATYAAHGNPPLFSSPVKRFAQNDFVAREGLVAGSGAAGAPHRGREAAGVGEGGRWRGPSPEWSGGTRPLAERQVTTAEALDAQGPLSSVRQRLRTDKGDWTRDLVARHVGVSG